MKQEYDEFYCFLSKHEYPTGFSKSQKQGLRRKATNYKVERDLLFYRMNERLEWKQVPRCGTEKRRILEACHSLPEGIVHCF